MSIGLGRAGRRSALAGEALLLALVLALGLALRLRSFVGLVRPDSLDYAHDAVNLLRGAAVFTEQANPIHVTRITVTLPLALVYRLFGYGELAAVAWPLAASLAGIAITYVAGRALLGARAGLLAALLLALHPLDIAYATQLLPDGILATLLTLSAVCFLTGLVQQRRVWWLVAGLALGLAYYARLNTPVVVGVFALWLLALRGPWRSLAWTGSGFALVLVAAAGVFTLWGGDPFYDLRRSFMPLFAPENRDIFRAPLTIEHLTSYVRWFFAPPARLWTAIALLGALAGWRWQRAATVVLLVWLGWLLLYFELLSQWPVVSMPEKGDRFLLPLLPPLTLLGALALDRALVAGTAASAELLRQTGSLTGVGWNRSPLGRARAAVSRLRRRRAVVDVLIRSAEAAAMTARRGGASLALRAAVLGLLLASAVQPSLARLGAEAAALRGWVSAEPRAVASALAALPPKPVYLTTNWKPWLDLFLGFPGLAPGDTRPALERLPFGEAGLPAPVRDAYVVHDRGVIVNRPLAWREVATPTARSVIYLAPSDALPPCPIGSAVLPSGAERSAPDRLSSLERERLGDERAPCAALDAYAMDLEAELFRGLAPAGSAPVPGASGWTSYEQSFYSAGGAAITRLAGAPIWQNIWRLPPGEYRVRLRVYDQGNGGRNVLAVRLNHAMAIARWEGREPGVREVEIFLADADGGNLLALTPLFVGQGTLIVDRVTISRGRVPPPEPIAWPVAIEAEHADGLALAPGGDYARARGWTTYAMPFYAGGLAAITREEGVTIALPLPVLPAGDYSMTIAVYDYGNGGENVLEIALNGALAHVAWSGSAPGVRRLRATLHGASAGADLRLRALRNGQGYVIVDRVSLEPGET